MNILRICKRWEKIRGILVPLRLPRRLMIKAQDCDGVSNAWYDDGSVTICYEFVDDIWKNAAAETTTGGISPIDTVIGPLADVVLHEVGHAVFEILSVPIFGREEDAADQFSVYIMLQFRKDHARRLILGNAYQYKNDLRSDAPIALTKFADEHGTPAQRFYNVLCLAYGSDPKFYQEIVEGYLPKTVRRGMRRRIQPSRRRVWNADRPAYRPQTGKKAATRHSSRACRCLKLPGDVRKRRKAE